MTRFQVALTKFEPATEGQKLLHGETLRAYNDLIHSRRQRLGAVGTGLPSVMWAVIIIGAFISLSASFFFKVEDMRLEEGSVQIGRQGGHVAVALVDPARREDGRAVLGRGAHPRFLAIWSTDTATMTRMPVIRIW